ncbi:DUF3048 domain-containing protein [Actinomadura parmotrematis]|uniref:DUF3048 domain-containing protein n=1 Tax=Actinomadura parmotrematis TaxID=2864039 RepID=A0ABS7G1E3_9ACTN|nr:DUF3048 domain-containing protein [Actinomadura parmotrematis]MBW8486524.1 DUF3048 domain-containing protein [Actinomadura parmotrematis]
MRCRRAAAGGAAVLAVTALTSCSDGDKPAKVAPTTAGTPASPAPTATAAATHPFTGGTAGLRNPVLAVKIENTRPAMPQSGVKSADIVYVEQVEGGETRLMAVFSSHLPKKVGPVRSARISDLHLLPQFGRPAFAFSGVQSKMKKYVRKAPVEDISQDNGGSAYYRGNNAAPPYNLYADPHDLLKQAPKAQGPRDVGFRFGPAPEGGTPVKTASAKWPAANMAFTWSAKEKRWLASWGGRPDMAREGGRLGGRTVVLQYAKTTRSKFHDFLGSYTPLIKTTGTGRATVLRDGKSYSAKWSRPSEDKGTTFTTTAGAPMTFATGQVWIVLLNDGKPYIP